jgi:putative chitinase
MITLNESHITRLVSSNKNTTSVVEQLVELCAKHEINTTQRLAMFIAQCLHESGGFRYMSEIWGPTEWQKKYEGHVGLGNTEVGDGSKFRGRGLIQLTGRNNYTAFSKWANDPAILETPEIVSQPKYAVLSAIYFWSVNNLNQYADKDDIEGCTRRVNGKKMLGLIERKHFYEVLKSLPLAN